MKLRIEFYGRLKDAGMGEIAELDIPASVSPKELLSILAERLGNNRDLLVGAVIANESEVLSPEAVISEDGRLAVLPPVCGG